MRKIEIGQVIAILANVAVLVGILLLVYELNQNRRMMQSQTRYQLSQGLVDILFELRDDADIVARGNRGDSLSEVESVRYQFDTVAQLRYHENVYYQYRSGLYDDAEYAAQREQWRGSVFQNRGLVDIFCRMRPGFSQPFVAEIESLLSVHRCE